MKNRRHAARCLGYDSNRLDGLDSRRRANGRGQNLKKIKSTSVRPMKPRRRLRVISSTQSFFERGREMPTVSAMMRSSGASRVAAVVAPPEANSQGWASLRRHNAAARTLWLTGTKPRGLRCSSVQRQNLAMSAALAQLTLLQPAVICRGGSGRCRSTAEDRCRLSWPVRYIHVVSSRVFCC